MRSGQFDFKRYAPMGQIGAKRREETDMRLPHSKSKFEKGKAKRRKVEKNNIEAETLYTPTIEEWGDIVENEKSDPSFIDQILPAAPGEGILVAGRTGIGKTNLCLYMAYCLASGKPFYGFKCEKTAVAYFAFEGGKTNYLERNNKIKKLFPPGTGSRVRFALIPTQGPKEMYLEVIGRLVELPDVRVLILDGARHIVQGDPSKTENAQNFIQQLKANLVELGMSSILTFQITKPNKNSLVHPGDIYTIKGAVEFAAWSTTSLLLEKQMRREKVINLYFDKHRIATKADLEPIEMTFDFDHCCFNAVSAEVAKAAERWSSKLRRHNNDKDSQIP